MKRTVLSLIAFSVIFLSGANSSARVTGPYPTYQDRAMDIVDLYRTLLDRPVNAIRFDEVNYWVNYSLSQQPMRPLSSVVWAILRSDERFVAQAYRNHLHRVGDQGGIQYYIHKLQIKAMTRQQLIDLFQNVCSQRINGECSK